MSRPEFEVRLAGPGDADALVRAGDTVFDHAVQRAVVYVFTLDEASDGDQGSLDEPSSSR